jgi:hypothetical protein
MMMMFGGAVRCAAVSGAIESVRKQLSRSTAEPDFGDLITKASVVHLSMCWKSETLLPSDFSTFHLPPDRVGLGIK